MRSVVGDSTPLPQRGHTDGYYACGNGEPVPMAHGYATAMVSGISREHNWCHASSQAARIRLLAGARAATHTCIRFYMGPLTFHAPAADR